jgi:predicted NBD/HSP70 family sugar kinase
MLFVAVGMGIGAGIILDGRLYRGRNGVAGELGDLRTSLTDPTILEAKAGARAVVARYAAHGGDVAGVDPEIVFARAKAGDPAATAAIQEVIEDLALGLLNAAVLVNPDVIVIGGGMGAAGETLLGPVRELMRPLIQDMPDIRASILGADATLVGAVEWSAEYARKALIDAINEAPASVRY